MVKYFKHGFSGLLVLALFIGGVTAWAGSPKGAEAGRGKVNAVVPEDARIIADMASNDPRKVLNALDDLEDRAHPSTNAIVAARKLLPDPRPSVRKKAARVLGVLHAQVDQEDIRTICRMLKSYDESEAGEALKALRGLNAREAIPEITPLLKSPHKLLIRDACRTLAVLGTKELIPLIEPLLEHPDTDIRTDAKSAIAVLQANP